MIFTINVPSLQAAHYSPGTLLKAENGCRIDAGSATRRKIAGEQTCGEKYGGGQEDGRRIRGVQAEEHRGD